MFIDRIKTKEELTLEHNMRMLLKSSSNESAKRELRLAGNGRLINVSDNTAHSNNNNADQPSQANNENSTGTTAAANGIAPGDGNAATPS